MIRQEEQREVAAYERHVSRNVCDYHYLKVGLEFEERSPGLRLNAAHFKQLIVSALKDLHGEIGAALPVDVLRFEEETLAAILRVKSSITIAEFPTINILWVTIDQKLNWTSHINTVATRADQRLGILCGLVKLWSALTLLGSYQNQKCAFRVTQVSPFLLALSGNSREFVLN
ncbi:ribonuclease P protein subunit p14 isoform X1 [Heterodontus francisci]|uniref:ribonuclease P protein subunit p14 isoform X1 n=1 Tax=Heterodontus francisci TaxID=7792 RepID=UPI00355C8E19